MDVGEDIVKNLARLLFLRIFAAHDERALPRCEHGIVLDVAYMRHQLMQGSKNTVVSRIAFFNKEWRIDGERASLQVGSPAFANCHIHAHASQLAECWYLIA